MSGRVVRPAEQKHGCDPGWTYRPVDPENDDGVPPGWNYGVPPTPDRFPRGTVWECECGRTWVSLGSPAFNMPGVCEWRPERRLERWLRLRKERR